MTSPLYNYPTDLKKSARKFLDAFNKRQKEETDMSDDPKQTIVCSTCKFCKVSWFARITGEAERFKCAWVDPSWTAKVNKVTGKVTKEPLPSCSDQRSFSRGHCKSEGIHWVPKNKEDLFFYIKKISANGESQ